MIARIFAQSGTYATDVKTLLAWFGVVLAAALILVAVGRYLRRRARPGTEPEDQLWSLPALRALQAQGKLADGEFEVLKTRAIVDASDRQLWTLQDLRDMKASGELADDEFELARARLLAAISPPGEDQGPDQPEEPPAGDPEQAT